MIIPYTYAATLIRVIDGDTVDVTIDVGFHLTTVQRLRLLGINAPEMHGPSHVAGISAKAWLIEALDGKTLYVRTHKSDVFGRWLAELLAVSEDGSEININQAMLDAGQAVAFNPR